MKLAPTLAEHEDNISLNQELFRKWMLSTARKMLSA